MTDNTMIEEQIRYLNVEDFDGPLMEIVALLQGWQEKYVTNGEFSSIRISAEHDYDDVEIRIFGLRIETDEELEARVAKEKKANIAKVKRKQQAAARADKEMKASLTALMKKHNLSAEDLADMAAEGL